MCVQQYPYCYSEQLYDRYKSALEEYIESSVSVVFFLCLCEYVQIGYTFPSLHSRPIDILR